MDHTQQLIHPDQAGFIPNRSIFDHIRLAKAILNYVEIMEENGSIIALDQEKAYDKIRHDYLWKTMEAFNPPPPFIRTVQALYNNTQTRVAINGVLSEPFKVKRSVRQGDLLSCPLFDLAIELLACQIQNNQNITGIIIPGIENAIKIKLFADDTNLFLNKEDRLDYIQDILNKWCKLSGARFNIEKTEIIPMGSDDHRKQIITSRKINPDDRAPLPKRIHIAKNSEAVQILGAWIGNKVNDVTPWEPIIDTINAKLKTWEKTHPTMNRKQLIIQAIVGGHTQFLTKAQGMPKPIEKALEKTISKFIWGQESKPWIAPETLQCPINEGGLNILNIQARNEAIELIWLKAYLNFTPSCQQWAIITDHIILTTEPDELVDDARNDPLLQTWKFSLKGPKADKLNNNIKRMLKMAKKYNTKLTAIKITPYILAQLPAWYHVATENRPLNNSKAKCLL